MNKTPRLSKSGIEYLDYSWGIWSGCRNLETGICHVKACWAKGLTTHYPKIYPDGFNPHYYPEALDSPKHLRKPSIISVGWVGDIIGYCDSNSIAAEDIVRTIKDCPQHTFLFLTKNPEKLFQWNFPENCWVGVSATDYNSFYRGAISYLPKIQAKVKYISFEPLLEGMGKHIGGWLTACLIDAGIKWAIIGACTGTMKELLPLHRKTSLPMIRYGKKWILSPPIGAIQEIVRACDEAGVKVFLKDSLFELLPIDAGHFYQPVEDGDHYQLRQELPNV